MSRCIFKMTPIVARVCARDGGRLADFMLEISQVVRRTVRASLSTIVLSQGTSAVCSKYQRRRGTHTARCTTRWTEAMGWGQEIVRAPRSYLYDQG
jgi:hypothetical protein